MAEAAGDPGVRPGMVVVPQTFGSSVNVALIRVTAESLGAAVGDRAQDLALLGRGREGSEKLPTLGARNRAE